MHVRSYLRLLVPALLCAGALGAFATAAQPAAADVVSGYVADQYHNPLGGMLVEAVDAESGDLTVGTITSVADGFFSLVIDVTPSGGFKIRVSDPAGTYSTIYYKNRSSFETADVFDCG